MKRMNKIFGRAICLAAVMGMGLSLVSCGGKKADAKGTVRFLNFKPEVADIYQELAAAYEKETGVKVVVETAANNSYEQTLVSKMATKEAPTLFQINGPRGYANWKDYCQDLSGTELYKHLADKSLAITSGSGVYGIPYVVEGYGIIYNKALTDKYFALTSKAVSYSSMDEINNFAKLKEVVEDMQKNAKELGIDGVFASTSLKAGEDWRWQTHLANLPVYYEFKNGNVDLASDATKKISFSYGKNFQNILDLYLNVVDGLVVYDKVINKRLMSELPFMATENIMMDAVKAGGNRQELHEKIRQLSMKAGANVKINGGDNNLLELIAEEESFGLSLEDLSKTMDPSKYTGRAKDQTLEFVRDVINPILEENSDLLGLTAEINV